MKKQKINKYMILGTLLLFITLLITLVVYLYVYDILLRLYCSVLITLLIIKSFQIIYLGYMEN